MQRVARELRTLVVTPLDGIRYVPQDDEHVTAIHVEISGPTQTPYEGGAFMVKLSLSAAFPNEPPKGVFLTKIFHPNIAPSTGAICVNTLKKDWSPKLGIAHVLQVIRCLLIVPFPESSLNDEAGRLFMESYEEYARRARLWTKIHAVQRQKNKLAELDPMPQGLDSVAFSDGVNASISTTAIVSPTSRAAVKKRPASDSPATVAAVAAVAPLSKKLAAKKKSIKRL